MRKLVKAISLGLFKKYISPEFKQSVQCIRVNDNAMIEEYYTELGITEDRHKELADVIVKVIKDDMAEHADKEGKMSPCNCLIEVSKECKHPNELALASMMVGTYIAMLNNPMNRLRAMM